MQVTLSEIIPDEYDMYQHVYCKVTVDNDRDSLSTVNYHNMWVKLE